MWRDAMSAGKTYYFFLFAVVVCRCLCCGRINAIHIYTMHLHILSAFVQTLGKHKHNESRACLEEIVYRERKRLTGEKRLLVWCSENWQYDELASRISYRVKIARTHRLVYIYAAWKANITCTRAIHAQFVIIFHIYFMVPERLFCVYARGAVVICISFVNGLVVFTLVAWVFYKKRWAMQMLFWGMCFVTIIIIYWPRIIQLHSGRCYAYTLRNRDEFPVERKF